MVAQQSQSYSSGSRPAARSFYQSQPQRDPNAPKPEAKETGRRCWQVVHSYRCGESYSDITAICAVKGGVIVRTTSKNARGCSQALVFVPGATVADFTSTGGAR